MSERQMSPEKLREFRLNDFVKGIIRGATGLKEKSDDSGTNTVSVAEFNATQEMLRGSIEKAMSEGFALREIIEKLKPALDSGEYKLEPHEDQLNLTALLRSCAMVEGSEEEGQKEKINEVIIKDIEETKTVAEPVRVNFSMVPPDDLPGPQVDREKSTGTGIEKRTLPRTEELISLLQNFDQMEEGDRYYRIQYDAGLAGQDPKIAERMRKKEYDMFVIPELQVMILVCDEEGNSTFVVRRPCLSQEDLQQKMAGNKIDSSAGDDPRFYAGLKKSQLYNLVNEEDRNASIVVEVEWNSEEWADDILDAITAPMINAGGEISFGDIAETAGRVEENKRLVHDFLGKIDTAELRYVDIDKSYDVFLMEFGLTKEKCSRHVFSHLLFSFLESNIGFSPRKLAQDFLIKTSDEDLKKLAGNILYDKFLQECDIRRETWRPNAFRVVLKEECDKRGIVRDFKINEMLRGQIRVYLDKWTVEQLLSVNYNSLYDRLAAEGVLNTEQISRSQIAHLLDQVRRSKGIKKREIASADILKKVDDFFDLERIPGSADLLEVDLRKSGPVIYKQFLEHTGLTEEQYSYRAFNTKLTRERKGKGIELHDKTAELMKTYFEARDASEPDSVANSDLEQIYQDFLQKNNLEATVDLRSRFSKNRVGYLDRIGKRSKESQKKLLVDNFFLGLSLSQLGIGQRMNRERTQTLYEQCLEKTGLAQEEYSFAAFQVKLIRERNAKQERGGAPDREADLMRAYFEAKDVTEPGAVVNSDLIGQMYQEFLQENSLESSEDLRHQFRRNRLSHLGRKGLRAAESRTKSLTDNFFLGLSLSQLGIGQSMNIERTRVLYKKCLEETGLTPEEYSFSAFNNKLTRARIVRARGNNGND